MYKNTEVKVLYTQPVSGLNFNIFNIPRDFVCAQTIYGHGAVLPTSFI